MARAHGEVVTDIREGYELEITLACLWYFRQVVETGMNPTLGICSQASRDLICL